MAEATVQVKEAKVGLQTEKWTRYDVIDGNDQRFATFSKSMYEQAKGYVGKRAELEYEETEKGLKLLSIKAASSQNGETPPLGTGEYVTGQKPTIEVRRIFASTAWNCAANMARADLGFDAAKHIADRIFEDLLRKGKAMEDSDIPF